MLSTVVSPVRQKDQYFLPHLEDKIARTDVIAFQNAREIP